ncbi:MAG: NAD(P)H-dependent glycerol-3-phosphate dehydrogenase [Bacteroidetes bacterium]|nr:NAD(P)H-dependent glycerol-3-phosphate dehydrogenase [Bacteroidota bacterium]
MSEIGIIGGGSWATALAKILSENHQQHHLHWWLRTEAKADYIRSHGHNPDYISSVDFTGRKINYSNDILSVINSAEYILLAVPSAFLHSALNDLPADIFSGKKIISAIKGLIPETGQILGDYLNSTWNITHDDFAVITGPCHAEEVALERLSYLTVASENANLSSTIASFLNCRFIKTSTTDDIFGTEYSAVLKNIYAIAAGICHGMGYGDNFLAVLVSNAIREIKRFISVVHPIQRDIDDSAYLGDLMVTAYSQFSRNRTFGHMLGKGYSVTSAQLEMNMVAEGYYATSSIHRLNEKYKVEMPILDFVFSVIYEKKPARKIVEPFLNRLN